MHKHVRKFFLFAVVTALPATAVCDLHPDPKRLVERAGSIAVASPHIQLAGVRTSYQEDRVHLINTIKQSDFCQHIDVSKARFQEALGASTVEMPAIRIALEAMQKSNIEEYCRGI